MKVIQAEALTKRYGHKRALNGLTLSVTKGEIYGLVGNNGAGKSTFLRAVAGLLRPDSGNVVRFEDPIHNGATPQGLSRVGALIDGPGFLRYTSAHHNLMIKALALGIPEPRRHTEELLTLVGLNEVSNQKVKGFSLGMRARLGIALALVGNPDLLLLDEPFNGIDPEGVTQIRRLITSINQERGVTLVVSTHVLDQLHRVATRYGVIAHGCLVAELTDEELHQARTTCIMLRTDDPTLTVAVLEEAFSAAEISVLADNSLQIRGVSQTELSRTLLEKNIGVLELTSKERDLDEYFVELMNGGE